MGIERLPARALYCHITGEKSKKTKKWLDNIKEDVQLWNIELKMQ